MEKNTAEISPSASNEDTITQHKEKSEQKSPPKCDKIVESDIIDASALDDVVSADDFTQEDDEIFEDAVEDASELKDISETCPTDEKYFSDIESSDNSQVYEPESGSKNAEEEKVVDNSVKSHIEGESVKEDITSKVIDSVEVELELVESDEDFEESSSQLDDVGSVVPQIVENLSEEKPPSEVRGDTNVIDSEILQSSALLDEESEKNCEDADADQATEVVTKGSLLSKAQEKSDNTKVSPKIITNVSEMEEESPLPQLVEEDGNTLSGIFKNSLEQEDSNDIASTLTKIAEEDENMSAPAEVPLDVDVEQAKDGVEATEMESIEMDVDQATKDVEEPEKETMDVDAKQPPKLENEAKNLDSDQATDDVAESEMEVKNVDSGQATKDDPEPDNKPINVDSNDVVESEKEAKKVDSDRAPEDTAESEKEAMNVGSDQATDDVGESEKEAKNVESGQATADVAESKKKNIDCDQAAEDVPESHKKAIIVDADQDTDTVAKSEKEAKNVDSVHAIEEFPDQHTKAINIDAQHSTEEATESLPPTKKQPKLDAFDKTAVPTLDEGIRSPPPTKKITLREDTDSPLLEGNETDVELALETSIEKVYSEDIVLGAEEIVGEIIQKRSSKKVLAGSSSSKKSGQGTQKGGPTNVSETANVKLISGEISGKDEEESNITSDSEHSLKTCTVNTEVLSASPQSVGNGDDSTKSLKYSTESLENKKSTKSVKISSESPEDKTTHADKPEMVDALPEKSLAINVKTATAENSLQTATELGNAEKSLTSIEENEQPINISSDTDNTLNDEVDPVKTDKSTISIEEAMKNNNDSQIPAKPRKTSTEIEIPSATVKPRETSTESVNSTHKKIQKTPTEGSVSPAIEKPKQPPIESVKEILDSRPASVTEELKKELQKPSQTCEVFKIDDDIEVVSDEKIKGNMETAVSSDKKILTTVSVVESKIAKDIAMECKPSETETTEPKEKLIAPTPKPVDNTVKPSETQKTSLTEMNKKDLPKDTSKAVTANQSQAGKDKSSNDVETMDITATPEKKADQVQSINDAVAIKTTETPAAPDEDESLLIIDTSHEEDNEPEPEDIDMDTETEQTATSNHSTTDSSSESSQEPLEVFHNKECVHYECKRACNNFFVAPLFTLSHYKISKKRKKTQYVCEDCYDSALNAYKNMCETLMKKEPLLSGTTFKALEFVEIIDSSDEEDTADTQSENEEKIIDENGFSKSSIRLFEEELDASIQRVMKRVDLQKQLTWATQMFQQRLDKCGDEIERTSIDLRELQKRADNMHNSLYQCPKIKIRQLTPLDLNSGRTYNPESETSIPPMGEIVRPEIYVNETYYAVKNKAIASWVPCKVMEALDAAYIKSVPHYKIKFLKSKYPMLKTVAAKHMAYFNSPRVRLPIGTRVIAYFDATTLSRGKEKMLIPSAFYPGIIAEPLKQSNKFRYLVFYDDGYFQYVYHKDVRLVCQASDNVWEDVHHQSREFIHNYLTQYAVNRPMVQTQKGQSMLVDYNGKWIYARVIDVDCSLVRMLFEGQSRSEWIYRGSTRLGPVYKESNKLMNKEAANTSRIARRTEPFIRYTNGEESTSQQTQEPQQSQSKAGEVRSVAKKSVSKIADNTPLPASSVASTSHVPAVRHLNNSTIFVEDDNKPKGKVVFYTAKKSLPPRQYKPHVCDPSCPFEITHNLSCYSPLAKPLLSGWERQVFRQKSRKFIVYRGPCGKRMRNMDELHRYLRVTENNLNVDNFDFGTETNCLAEYVIETSIVHKKDISMGEEKMPIPCVNYYDNTMPPDCVYSSRRIPTEGVNLNLDPEFMVGCDCEDDCSDKDKCSCWELTYAGAKYSTPNVPNHMVGYQHKRLYDNVLTGIYECNSRCKCKANCVNRVVQEPLQSKLQVFKTSNRGWGLRCINDIPRGSFICVYAGHLLTEQKANEGGKDAGDEYFAELDYIEVAEQIKEGYESDVNDPFADEDLYNPERDSEDDDEFVGPTESQSNRSFNTRSTSRRSTKSSTSAEHDSQERQVISFEPNKTMGQPESTSPEKQTIRKLYGKDEACYVMDAKITGNLGRYFNHSCSPNLFVQNVLVDTHDLRFPWVAFFAANHIRAGTELTWNYNYEVGVVPGKVLYCQCGSANCRQRLL